MLRKLVFLLSKIDHSKPMPGLVMPSIYPKGTLITLNSILKILQGNISGGNQTIAISHGTPANPFNLNE
ncbi:unnamed protein product [Dovyalis caffra]|uniref:NADH dehydrogenase subunit 4 n=1 Tax=Dovyalis caffra TaxID=77055 RepID=A0AAV1RPK7_9ROSI|nr:unnamed protein product [Dovyalis caffra]